MVSIVAAIVVLGMLVFVHELGHFLMCKLIGVGVEKFSLGFGPKVVGWRYGETEYLISAFPLGGYVKMFGEGFEETDLTEEEKRRSFVEKSPLQRLCIAGAGPVFNLLFAWVLFIVVYLMGVPAVTTKVGDLVPGKPAAAAGLAAGDVVVSVDGRKVDRWDDLAAAIAGSGGRTLTIGVQRNGTPLTFTVKPEVRQTKNLFGEATSVPAIGIASSGEVVTDRFSPPAAFVRGSVQTWNVIGLTLTSLVKLAERVVPLNTIGGPIMIAKMAGQQAAAGGVSFLAFTALLSINLGVLNLLPIPVLDGGHLFFCLIEIVFRRPVSMKARETAQQVGLFLLIALMVLAFYNDIARYVLGQG